MSQKKRQEAQCLQQEEEGKYLTFELDGEEYGLEILKEIISIIRL